MQIYLSVSHSPQDRSLLDTVLTHLRPVAQRHNSGLFSAADILPGTDVRDERLRLLAQADLLLLLLSPDYLAHYGDEAREAVHQRHRGAEVVPIRARPVDIHKDEPFVALQMLPAGTDFLTQRAPAEQDAALAELSRSVDALLRVLSTRPRPESGPAPLQQKRRLPPPPGSCDPAYRVLYPKIEKKALRLLEDPGVLLLQAPHHFGKASLVAYLLEKAAAGNTAARIARVDLGLLLQEEPAVLNSLGALVRRLGLLWVQALQPGLGPAEAQALVDAAFGRPGTDPARLKDLLETQVLPHADPLFLCISRLDLVHGRSCEHPFQAMLRSWAVSDQPLWQRLRLVATVSTEPTLLQSTDHSGLVAASTVMEVPPLTDKQARDLAAQYGLSAGARGLDQVYQRVNGHPHLLRLWLHEAAIDEVEPAEVEEWQVVRAHLLGLKRELKEGGLLPALAKAVADEELSAEEYGALYRLGLIEAAGVTKVRFRSPLYQDFAKELCPRR